MGCGSSSTNVQAFRNPEENANYRTQRAPSRHSSAASSERQRSANIKSANKRKSSASNVSLSSAGSRRQVKADDVSRVNTASTKKTYTIQRPNSDITHLPVALHDENENTETEIETPVQDFQNVVNDDETEEKKSEAKRHHETIQKQTFLTGDPEDEEVKDITTRAEKHEEIAKRKEATRALYDPNTREEDLIKEYGLVALNIPEMEHSEPTTNYTIDDIITHNNECCSLDWFKYGKKVYSWKKMEPIIKERTTQYEEKLSHWYYDSVGNMSKYPIHIARGLGVSRKELARILPVCCVGNCVEISREEYLSRMKQSAENVLEEETDSEYFGDYRQQLERWLSDYPMNKVYNDPPNPQTDPNEAAFPLPADIQADPHVLRKWIEAWVAFDLEVPEGGAWPLAALLNDDWGDVHELYAEEVQKHHDDGSMEPLDMEIDGDVAWIEIELNLVKNDTATDAQEIVWKKRAKRTNLNDPEWMKQRRIELAQALKQRYEKRQVTYPVENYTNFAELLEKHWREFQELCGKEFTRPEGGFKKKRQLPLGVDKHKQMDGTDAVLLAESNDNRLVIGHESDDDTMSFKSKSDKSDNYNVNHETDERVESSHSNRLGPDYNADEHVEYVSEDKENGGDRLVFTNENDEEDRGGMTDGEEGNQLIINHDDATQAGANETPVFETTDSGLEMDSAEPQEHVHGVDDNGNKDNDNTQQTDKPGDTPNGVADDDFY